MTHPSGRVLFRFPAVPVRLDDAGLPLPARHQKTGFNASLDDLITAVPMLVKTLESAVKVTESRNPGDPDALSVFRNGVEYYKALPGKLTEILIRMEAHYDAHHVFRLTSYPVHAFGLTRMPVPGAILAGAACIGVIR
jgi:hypothetical protein